ncbi:hypothetical protein [Rhodospirillaceae bacterium SYSU D60014]|uniref:hypothetical protein n=1 Tax=Virgifigura deserti TaxID=2268457 RepID=UPI000E66BA40
MTAQPPTPTGSPSGSPPGSPSGSSLPISGTAAEVFHLLWSNRDGFLRTVLVPVAASFTLALLAYSVAESNILPLILAADLIPTTLFAVSWHRLILMGPQEALSAPVIRWGNRETTYLWRSILLMIGIVLAMAIPFSFALAMAQRSAAGHLIMALVSLAALFIMLRLALVLPAGAVDARYGFAQSWGDTAARGFQLMAIVLLVALPLFVALHIVNGLIASTGLAAAAPLTTLLLNSVGSYLFLAALLTVLALAFRRLSGWQDSQGAAVPAP